MRRVGAVEPRDFDEQCISWAYWNLAMSTNHKPNREALRKAAAAKFGWSAERFDAWADKREWWPK